MRDLPVSITVRAIRCCDLRGVVEVEAEAFGPRALDSGELRALVRPPFSDIIVAVWGGRVMGFAAYRLVDSDELKEELGLSVDLEPGCQCLFIPDLAVRPECRRWGVGSVLLAELVEKMVRNDLGRVVIIIREHNDRAQLFFRDGVWFKCVGVEHGYFVSGEVDGKPTFEDGYVFSLDRPGLFETRARWEIWSSVIPAVLR